MKLFKNFKTKKQLRRELEEIKRIHMPSVPQIRFNNSQVDKFTTSITLENDMPLHIAHTVLAQQLTEVIKDNMEIKLTEEYGTSGIIRGLKGSIYLVRKDENNGQIDRKICL
ncbi:MAG: hypothetical protein IJA32_06605 [Lachnospiraceae bacterium]|nr:hypothetical protein [Lachnospiraceae bacterium]